MDLRAHGGRRVPHQPAATRPLPALAPALAAQAAAGASHVRGQPGLPPPQRRRLRRRRARFGLRHLRLRDGLLGLRPAPASRRAARGQHAAPTAVTAAVGFAAAAAAAVAAAAAPLGQLRPVWTLRRRWQVGGARREA